MIFWIADDRDAAAVGANRCPFRHGVRGVVGPLAMHVRFQELQERVNGWLGKNHDVIDRAQSRDQLGAIGSRQDGPVGTLVPAHRRIIVDRHDQAIGFAPGRFEVAHVPDVQQVESAVRECVRETTLPVPGYLLEQFVA
jgi:hypothetical protein